MAKYAGLDDCADGLVAVDEKHLLSADTWVDSDLLARGIKPADVPLPNDLLTELAKTYALSFAANDGSVDADSALAGKAAFYKRLADGLVARISRDALGLAQPVGASFGTVSVGRG